MKEYNDKSEKERDAEARKFWRSAHPRIKIPKAVMDELCDYYFILQQVPLVYCEVTGNRLSKPNYFASSVIDAYNDEREREIREAVEEAKKVWDAVEAGY